MTLAQPLPATADHSDPQIRTFRPTVTAWHQHRPALLCPGPKPPRFSRLDPPGRPDEDGVDRIDEGSGHNRPLLGRIGNQGEAFERDPQLGRGGRLKRGGFGPGHRRAGRYWCHAVTAGRKVRICGSRW